MPPELFVVRMSAMKVLSRRWAASLQFSEPVEDAVQFHATLVLHGTCHQKTAAIGGNIIVRIVAMFSPEVSLEHHLWSQRHKRRRCRNAYGHHFVGVAKEEFLSVPRPDRFGAALT